jgi:hypothetical protein
MRVTLYKYNILAYHLIPLTDLNFSTLLQKIKWVSGLSADVKAERKNFKNKQSQSAESFYFHRYHFQLSCKLNGQKMGTAEKETPAKVEETKEVKEEKKDPALLTLEDVREHCRLLERSVVSKESRFAVRVLRGLPATRKKLTTAILRKIINGFYTHSAAERDTLLGYMPDDVRF